MIYVWNTIYSCLACSIIVNGLWIVLEYSLEKPPWTWRRAIVQVISTWVLAIVISLMFLIPMHS